MDLLEESIRILKINSVSQTGNTEIVTYLSKLLGKLGLKTMIQSTIHRGVDQHNLICSIYGSSSKEIIFNTHLDTVSPGDPMKWDSTQFDPFNPQIIGNRIYGLGSADTKLDYLCKLKALLRFRNIKFKNPLSFVGTFGEEMGLVGCKFFLDSGFVKPKYVFVGEPTSLNLVYAHKGMIVIRIELGLKSKNDHKATEMLEFKGESAHGSTPHLGRNAILSAIQKLKDLPDNYELVKIDGGTAVNMVPIDSTMIVSQNAKGDNRKKLLYVFDLLSEIEIELHNDVDHDYDPAYSVLNIGTICTDTDKMSMRMAFRMLPKRDFQAILKKIELKLSSIGGTVILERDQPAMDTDRDSFLINKSAEILDEIGIKANKETKPASTEGALYQQTGAQSVVFGPGISLDNIHKPNEYNLIPQLHMAVLFYEKAIETFCLRKIE